MVDRIPLSGPAMRAYTSDHPCTWCDGCGNYGIWSALKRALVELGIDPWNVLLCFDVGCHGNMSDKILGYRFHGLHGRVIPLAAGAKIANPELTVIALGGDGASFSEGIGHLVHGIRSNYDITFILHNNANYGLTTGQASALTPQGQPMNSSPEGIPERTLNSMDFVFSLEPTFVARGFSGAIPQLTTIFKAAIEHRGFSYVDVLQACPTYNRFATHEYLMERCFDIAGEKYDAADLSRARALAVDTTGRIVTGVLYCQSAVPSFMHQLATRRAAQTTLVEEVGLRDVASLCSVFQ